MEPEASLTKKHLSLFPIFYLDAKILRVLGWEGFTLPFLICFDSKRPSRCTLRHEMIHHHQYMELLVVPFVALYLGWHAVAFVWYLATFALDLCRGKAVFHLRKMTSSAAIELINMSNFYAYTSNPFEQEAFANEKKRNYLERRSWFAWTQYVPGISSKWVKYSYYDD